MPDMFPQIPVEPTGVPPRQRIDFRIGVRVAPDRPLAENHKRTRQNVGALHGNAYRRRHIRMGQQIARTARNRVSAKNIHRVVHNPPLHLRRIVLGDGGHDGRLRPRVYRAARVAPHGFHGVQIPSHARQRLLYALESPDRQSELLPHRCMGRRNAAHILRPARAHGWKRDAPARGKGFHQHAPTGASPLLPPDDGVH